MGARIQSNDHLRIGQTVEGQGARHGYDVPAINQTLPVGAEGCIEMHLGRVLPKACGDHMFGLFDGDPIHMVDLFAHLIITPAVRFARKCEIVVGEIQPLRNDQISDIEHGFQVRNNGFRCRCLKIIFAHHHPTHIVHHNIITLI